MKAGISLRTNGLLAWPLASGMTHDGGDAEISEARVMPNCYPSPPGPELHQKYGRATPRILLANSSGCRGRGTDQDVEAGMSCARGPCAALPSC